MNQAQVLFEQIFDQKIEIELLLERIVDSLTADTDLTHRQSLKNIVRRGLIENAKLALTAKMSKQNWADFEQFFGDPEVSEAMDFDTALLAFGMADDELGEAMNQSVLSFINNLLKK